MARAQIDFFRAPESPCADHENANADNEGNPNHRKPPSLDGLSIEEVDDGSDHAGAGRDRHADKVFAARASRVRGRWIFLDVEARQAACSSNEKDKGCNCSEMNELGPQ